MLDPSEDPMEPNDPGVTDIASYLATKLPTGAETVAGAIDDWRTTLYNAKATRSEKPLADMVKRALPGDDHAAALADTLLPAPRR